MSKQEKSQLNINNKSRFIVMDCNSIIHRAFHALPMLTTKTGKTVNAVYGFLLVFFKVLKEFQPEFLAACFDVPGPTFRHKEYKEYKAKRPPAPQELYDQIPIIKEILKNLTVPIYEKEGFEGDDLIGTIANLIEKKQVFPKPDIIIVSGDTDLLQLVDENIRVYLLKRGVKETVLYDKKLVKEKYKLEPEQLIDFKSLKGDPTDNIPGVTGIGEKTAIFLIQEFGNIENLYENLKEKTEKVQKLNKKIVDILLKYEDQAFFSKKLVKIEKYVPIDFTLENCRRKKYNKDKVIEILEDLGFNSLINKIPFESDSLKSESQNNLKLFN